MAIYCFQCGKELPDDASFCMKCGKAVPAAVQQATPPELQWEYCEIEDRDTGDYSSLFNPVKMHYFIAVAVHPTKGRYIVAESGKYGYGGVDPKKGVLDAHTRINELMKSLSSEGWEPLPNKGPEWYSYKFRRQVKGAQGSGGGPKHTTAPISSSASQASPTPNSVVIPPLPPPPVPTPAKP